MISCEREGHDAVGVRDGLLRGGAVERFARHRQKGGTLVGVTLARRTFTICIERTVTRSGCEPMRFKIELDTYAKNPLHAPLAKL